MIVKNKRIINFMYYFLFLYQHYIKIVAELEVHFVIYL